MRVEISKEDGQEYLSGDIRRRGISKFIEGLNSHDRDVQLKDRFGFFTGDDINELYIGQRVDVEGLRRGHMILMYSDSPYVWEYTVDIKHIVKDMRDNKYPVKGEIKVPSEYIRDTIMGW